MLTNGYVLLGVLIAILLAAAIGIYWDEKREKELDARVRLHFASTSAVVTPAVVLNFDTKSVEYVDARSVAQKQRKGSPWVYAFYLWVIAQKIRWALLERTLRWRLDNTSPHKQAKRGSR